jgi:acetyltransferase-like isoleucine patch superfamily enzyme
MDPSLPIVFNDAELYRRLRADAYRCEVIPGATASHAYGTSLQRVARARVRAEFTASLRRYLRGEWGRLRRTALWAVLVLDALTSVVLGLTGPNTRAARVNARGVLGGLGLPGGATPWLAPIHSPPARAKAAVRAALPNVRHTMRRASRRVRRRWFIVRLHVAAWLARSHVEVRIHPTADLPRRCTFEVRPRCRAAVLLGPDVEIQPGLRLRLQGTLEVRRRSQIRHNVTLNVKGHLLLAGRNIVSHTTSVHADADTTFEWGACIAEYATVVDTDHAIDGSALHMFDQPVHATPIRLGAGSFVAAHSTVTGGATVGACSVVGANSVVSRDIPPGVVAVGSPATPIRTLPAWWLGSPDAAHR